MILKSVSIVLLAGLGLAACGSNKIVPDEFEVVNRAPLVVPPEAELSPPRPGEPRAQEINPSRQAYDALFPGEKIKQDTPKSKSEIDLLRRMAASDPDVRSNATGGKDQDVVKKRLLLAEILKAEERTFRPDNVTIERVSSTSVQ